jgi:chemotaxis methyl-accepting protein methylase
VQATVDDTIDGIARVASGGSYYDFSSLGSSTLRRRIERRQRRVGVTSPSQYMATLEHDASELESLRAGLLGTGIWLFRDPKTWEFIAQHALPTLFGRPQSTRPVRVWVPFCGMGADAYTVTILLLEQRSGYQFQVFASDSDKQSLALARAGRFPWVAGPEEARVRHFLVPEQRLYQVSKTLREAIVFARHDVLSDLPFSHIDLICCRYVLMHLQPEARRVVTEAFAHALDDDGYLVLSSLEQPDNDVGAFEPVPGQWGVYQRVPRAPRVVRRRALPTVVNGTVAIPSPTPSSRDGRASGDGGRVAQLLRLVTTGNLATSLAHDVSQPLGAIANLLHAAAMRVEAGAGRGELLDLLRQSSTQAYRAGRLVAHVRRLLHGGQRRVQRTELRRLITSAVKVMRPTLHRYGVDLHLALGKVPIESAVCRVEIEQVLVNLIQNAVDALSTVPVGRREIQLGTSLATAGEVCIIVADNGLGFAAGTEDRLFEPFFTTKAAGLGMGLAICKASVTDHGGGMWAERMADRTLMCFTLPLVRDRARVRSVG